MSKNVQKIDLNVGISDSSVVELRQQVRRMEAALDHHSRTRRRRLLLIGGLLSMVVHGSVVFYLASIYRPGPGRSITQPIRLDFAVVDEEELTIADEREFEDIEPQIVPEFDDLLLPDPAAELSPQVQAPQLAFSGEGAQPALGGSGGSEGAGDLGGGGSGTSFFGISSEGTRFAYIVDTSGSMGQQRKLFTAMHELVRSIDALPDYAYFYVVLFNTNIEMPQIQNGWVRAKKSKIRRLTRWLNDRVPGGGTNPLPGFHQVFSLDVRPDVIFFLTDGEIDSMSAEDVAMLNSRGKKVVINTIAFGDPSGQVMLKQIADESGGVYRYVASSGN